ncbi:uncharacterized protein AMSG_12247 [Thecamonas trahens ATCC 50062]|uniref:cAMP-dependent protein kinase regulatory subunit n=1 Tax=Thecamonas trahens ATCC 50062 TaxID=461836 RepID=A0A0L0DP44_THETB|nr:hypothetical protein AMSG_12247 [Thecamonas trahens ATCC 50062]KNC53193.1 hypothetical protein AMSG_12247 [Thecamonas trahens ATCC 50062]|eukprot:XP_013754701.1 hypothetical protein AMSG_12247 [Thecamonas trahens ATCC 50062]
MDPAALLPASGIPASSSNSSSSSPAAAVDAQAGASMRHASQGSLRSPTIAALGGRGRRGSISAEVLRPRKTGFKPPQHAKTPEAKARIRSAVAGHILFRHLDADQLTVVVNAMFELPTVAGTSIIRQGDPGDYFYIVDSGKFDIFVTPSGGGPTAKVLTVTAGGAFGELALMYNAPRAATCTAVKDSVLWALDRVTFNYILMDSTLAKRDRYQEFLRDVPLFRSADASMLGQIADVLGEAVFSDGEYIVRQGDSAADRFYIIDTGHVRVEQTSPDGETAILATLGSRDYFGEVALMAQCARNADVIASFSVKCVVLDRASFLRLVATPARMPLLSKRMATYTLLDSTAAAVNLMGSRSSLISTSDSSDEASTTASPAASPAVVRHAAPPSAPSSEPSASSADAPCYDNLGPLPTDLEGAPDGFTPALQRYSIDAAVASAKSGRDPNSSSIGSSSSSSSSSSSQSSSEVGEGRVQVLAVADPLADAETGQPRPRPADPARIVQRQVTWATGALVGMVFVWASFMAAFVIAGVSSGKAALAGLVPAGALLIFGLSCQASAAAAEAAARRAEALARAAQTAEKRFDPVAEVVKAQTAPASHTTLAPTDTAAAAPAAATTAATTAADANQATDSIGVENDGEAMEVDAVKAALRARSEVVTYFGETDAARAARLRKLLLHEGEFRTGEANEYSRALKAESERLLEEQIEALSAARPAERGTGAEYGEVYLGKIPADVYERLDARSVTERATRDGRRTTAKYAQTCSYLQPLFEELVRKQVHPEILAGLDAIVRELNGRDYINAMGHFVDMSIGNAPWPIGVTMVGIHERSGRERISAHKVAHVLNDDRSRKYIQSVKRLITWAQTKFPPDDASRLIG